MCRVAEGSVAAMFGHDKDCCVEEKFHRGLHFALLRSYTTQSLDVQLT